MLDGDQAMAVEAIDVATGDPHIDRGDGAAGHGLRLLDRLGDGVDRAFDVDHHTLAQTDGGMDPHADDIDLALRDVANHDTDLGRADIEPNYQFRIFPPH